MRDGPRHQALIHSNLFLKGMRLVLFRMFIIYGLLLACNLLLGQMIPVFIPSDNETVFYQNIEFAFPNSALDTRLQITNDKTFDKIIIDTLISGNVVIIPRLQKNIDHYWRIVGGKNTNLEPHMFKTCSVKIESAPINDFPIKLISTSNSTSQSVLIDNPDHKTLDVEVFDNMGKLLIKHRTDASIKGLDLNAISAANYEVNILSEGKMLKSKVSF